LIEDFGTGTGRSPTPYTGYNFSNGWIGDGSYAVAHPGASLPFFLTNSGTLTEDHTPGDVDGRMFAVNGAFAPGEFYRRTITGLTAGGTYYFSAYARNTYTGSPIDPNIRFEIRDAADLVLDTTDIELVQEGVWIEHLPRHRR